MRKWFIVGIISSIFVLSILGYGSFWIYQKNVQAQVNAKEIEKYKQLFKSHNDEQKRKYEEEFEKVELIATPFIDCRTQIDGVKDSLLNSYKLSLNQQRQGTKVSDEDKYRSDLYSFLKRFSTELYDRTYWYSSDRGTGHNYESEIFITDLPFKYNESAYQEELSGTQEGLKNELVTLQKDYDRIKRIYCPKISQPIKYPPSVEFCKELFKASRSLSQTQKPQKEDSELEEEYLLRLDQYEKNNREYERNAFLSCENDPSYRVSFH